MTNEQSKLLEAILEAHLKYPTTPTKIQVK